jgi:hypothetical protein
VRSTGVQQFTVTPMTLKYTEISKRPSIFLKLFGITPFQAEKICSAGYPLSEKKVLASYKRPARDYKLSFEDMV